MRSNDILGVRVLAGLLVFWLLLALLAAGCSRCSEPDKDAGGALIVSAPAPLLARLGPLLDLYKRQFPDERITLLADGGKPLAHRDTADIFITAGNEQADALKAAVKLIEPPKTYILDRVILVGRAGKTYDIRRPKHMLQPAFRSLVLPPESDPAGAAARELLGAWRLKKRLAPRIQVADTSDKALKELAGGRVDAAFVLQSEVRGNKAVQALLSRYMREPSFISYYIALSADPARHNRAKSLLEFLTSAGVIKKLVKSGYLLPGARRMPAPRAGAEQTRPKRVKSAAKAEALKADPPPAGDASDAAKKPAKPAAPGGEKASASDQATKGAKAAPADGANAAAKPKTTE